LSCATHNGQQLAYVYNEDEPGRRSAAKLLAKDEARRIAVNIGRLPERIGSPQHGHIKSRSVLIVSMRMLSP
jgi:hypothetical protein